LLRDEIPRMSAGYADLGPTRYGQASNAKEVVMANKDKGGSKAQKKAGKTLKEKRAAKKEKAAKGSRSSQS